MSAHGAARQDRHGSRGVHGLGRPSDDAADSTADDLDDERHCWVCGWTSEEEFGLDHDAWIADGSRLQPHDFEPVGSDGYATGEFLITHGSYDWTGVVEWAENHMGDADQPEWWLCEVRVRCQEDCEWWPSPIRTGMTLAEARMLAERLDCGALLGD